MSSTYYITAPSYWHGQVTLDSGSVIKYGPNDGLYIYGSILCNGTASAPSILTSRDEDVFGDRIDFAHFQGPGNSDGYYSTGTPTYSANAYIYLYYLTAYIALEGLQIRWAQTGIEIEDNGCGRTTYVLADSSFQYCHTGVYLMGGMLNVANSFQCNVGTSITGGCVSGSLTDNCSGNVDSDGDGIPNWWMVKYFGHPTGQASDFSRSTDDADSDGVSNYNEYIGNTSPIKRPVFSPVNYQIVYQGSTATFSCTTTPMLPASYYQWKLGYSTLLSSGTSISFTAQVPSNGLYYAFATPNNALLYARETFGRLVTCDDWGWQIWTNHLATCGGKGNNLWAASTTNIPPTMQWDTTCLLYGKPGFTGISQRNSYHPFGYKGQGACTLLTKRHGYTAGHYWGGTGGHPELVGSNVWFVTSDNQIIQATIKAGWTKLDSGYDYTIFLFDSDVDARIAPLTVTYTRAGNVTTYATGQLGKMSVNMPPFQFSDPSYPTAFNNFSTHLVNDSGSPDMLPVLEGNVVFMNGRTSSGPSRQMQADMDMLSTAQGLSPSLYQMTWYSPSVSAASYDYLTSGTWKGTYGSDGYQIVEDATSLPNWATISPSGGWTYLWNGSTLSNNALQRASSGRIAACYYHPTSFDVSVILTDGKPHQVALYLLDWDGNGARGETIQVKQSASPGWVLDQQHISGFQGGVYLMWDIVGNVTFHFINDTGSPNAVVSGIFLSSAR